MHTQMAHNKHAKRLISFSRCCLHDQDKVTVTMEEPVTLKFALRYLALFTKATPLGPVVTISMTPDNPVVVEYPIDTFGYVRYYLAPKIDEADE